jgi:hypothetical protein
MKTIEQINKEHAAALAALEIQTRLVNNMPPSVKPKYIHNGGYKCDASIIIEIDNRIDALPIIDALPPVPAVMHKDTFLSFYPLQSVEPGDEHHTSPITPVIWEADKTGDYRTNCNYKYWTMIDGLLVSVKLKIKKDPATHRARNPRAKLVATRMYYLTDAPTGGNVRKYADSGRDILGSTVIYWTDGTSLTEVIK